MRIRQITTDSEALAESILRRALAGTRWTFGLKLPLQVVLAKEAERLTGQEFSMYTRGHLDFTVINDTTREPAFAIEFDGFGHDNPRQVERDIIKNRLCAAAELPLFRIGVDELARREQISILEWLLDRFVTWERDFDDAADAFFARYEGTAIGREMQEHPEEVLGHLAGIFSSELPFPGNAAMAERLYRHFGISVGREVSSQEFPEDAPYLLQVVWPGTQLANEERGSSAFMAVERQARLRSSRTPDEDLFKTCGQARVAWDNRTGRTLEEFSSQVEPWWDPNWIVRDLALYDALLQVSHWAEKNLSTVPNRDRTPRPTVRRWFENLSNYDIAKIDGSRDWAAFFARVQGRAQGQHKN